MIYNIHFDRLHFVLAQDLKWTDESKKNKKNSGLEVYLDSLDNSLTATFVSNYKNKEFEIVI